MSKNSFQWFGLKAEGLIVILIGVGLLLHFKGDIYPIGEIAIVIGFGLIIADAIVTIQDKYWESKRRTYR